MNPVIRGEQWGEILLAELTRGDQPVADWMQGATRVIKRDNFSQVGLLSLAGEPCYLKCYWPKGSLQALQFRMGRGRGVASYDNAIRLAKAGLTVARPLTCVRARGALLLLTREVVGSRDLKSLWVEGLPEENLPALFASAAEVLSGWHGQGFFHGDCKWSNFLAAEDGICLVDLEGVGQGELTGQGCTRDLARFTVNAEDMGLPANVYQRFLAEYCTALKLTPEAVIGRIMPAVERLRRRHARKYGERGHRLV